MKEDTDSSPPAVPRIGSKKLKRKPGSPIDWSQIPELGKLPDAQVAAIYGLKVQTVANGRRLQGIPSTDRFAHKKASHKIDWDNEKRLGQVPDRVLQRLLKIGSASSVSQARTRRGIPRFEAPDLDDLLMAVYELRGMVAEAHEKEQIAIPLEDLDKLLKRNRLHKWGSKK